MNTIWKTLTYGIILKHCRINGIYHERCLILKYCKMVKISHLFFTMQYIFIHSLGHLCEYHCHVSAASFSSSVYTKYRTKTIFDSICPKWTGCQIISSTVFTVYFLNGIESRHCTIHSYVFYGLILPILIKIIYRRKRGKTLSTSHE